MNLEKKFIFLLKNVQNIAAQRGSEYFLKCRGKHIAKAIYYANQRGKAFSIILEPTVRSYDLLRLVERQMMQREGMSDMGSLKDN